MPTTTSKIVLKNIVVNIKGKKYKLTISVPLQKIVEALEENNLLVFKTETLSDGTEIMQRVDKWKIEISIKGSKEQQGNSGRRFKNV